MVTVCLNQAHSIVAAMESVLTQTDADVEYIVIDGGSTDGTAEIIEGHANRLAYRVSEPDRGQSHALNKGFARATGDVLGWLNADDSLMPGALGVVRERFGRDDLDVLCGACRYEYPDRTVRVDRVTPRQLDLLPTYDPIHQPSCFWRRSLHERVGGPDESLHFGMDWDLWLRFARAGAWFATTDEALSVYRVTGSNKTSVGGERRNREMYDILRQYNRGEWKLLTEVAYRLLWPLKRLRQRRPQWLYRPVSNTFRSAVLMALGPMLGFDRVRCSTHPFS